MLWRERVWEKGLDASSRFRRMSLWIEEEGRKQEGEGGHGGEATVMRLFNDREIVLRIEHCGKVIYKDLRRVFGAKLLTCFIVFEERWQPEIDHFCLLSHKSFEYLFPISSPKA